MNVSDVTVTAGLGGFFVLFGLGLVVWLLMRDMSRRMRNVNNDHAQAKTQEAERLGAEASAPAAVDDDATVDHPATHPVPTSSPETTTSREQQRP